MTVPRTVRSGPEGLPVYGYEPVPGLPQVDTLALAEARDVDGVPPTRAHAHDFFVVAYFERAGGWLRVGPDQWPVAAGDLYLVAPREVVDLRGDDLGGDLGQGGWGVSFSPEVLGAEPVASVLSWRTHPLLSPFARAAVGGPKRRRVPAPERAAWSARLRAIDRELHARGPGHREAVAAHLTLLLVEVTRLFRPVTGPAPVDADPALLGVAAEVLAVVDERYREPISLTDVARAVGVSPGHLTTVVRRRTGRTVQAWIAHRRLVEARRLLADTRVPVNEIGRRVGYPDPSYFARSFRKEHGVSPLRWRRAARAAARGGAAEANRRRSRDGQVGGGNRSSNRVNLATAWRSPSTATPGGSAGRSSGEASR